MLECIIGPWGGFLPKWKGMPWDGGVSPIDEGNLLGKAAGVGSCSEYEGGFLR